MDDEPGTPDRHAPTSSAGSRAARIRELNATIRYTGWSVFRSAGRLPRDRQASIRETDDYLAEVQAVSGVSVRGVYDVAGLRADADYLIWWHATRAEQLQAAYQGFRRTPLGEASTPVWSQFALHRPAEFNQSHIPAFLDGELPREYLCVYPFVRSYDWYLLQESDRKAMLAEHGMQARGYPDVRANTLAAFALGDYEWILALESDDLHRILDLMRHLRATEARRHVRTETPFYTGRKTTIPNLINALP
ncbi:hydrogen peroxide-dependent heme synthase [Saccharopolyspora sp. NPDC002376]